MIIQAHLSSAIRRMAAVAACLLLCLPTPAKDPMKQFIDQLMKRMTLEEKIGQLNLTPTGSIQTGPYVQDNVEEAIVAGHLGAVIGAYGVDRVHQLQRLAVEKSRLGIPLLMGFDVIHGFETIFPIPLGVASTWDIPAIEESARIAAREASAVGLNWTYSPMVDICVEARWGRVAEGAGEDPYLGARVAEAMVRGYQGDFKDENIMACVKHYGLYGASEAGREYNTVDMSRQRMYNQYFEPYKAAVQAGVGSVMSAFNIVDGLPATANRWLLTDVLRKEWGFRGAVVTDYGTIGEIPNHGTAADLAEASVQALKAGTDIDMCALGFVGTLAESVKKGLVKEKDIDVACRRVLEMKYKLGLFDNPYRFGDKERAKQVIYCREHRDVARRIAEESLVLLKNDNHLLPLKKQGTIALIGPLGLTSVHIGGSWSANYRSDHRVSLREAMERAVEGQGRIVWAQGANICYESDFSSGVRTKSRDIPVGNDSVLLQQAIDVARTADVLVCALGETAGMSGESGSMADINLAASQRRLLEEMVKLGKPIVMLNFSGRPTVLKWESEHVDALMNVWFPGSEGGEAITRVLFGDVAPSGRLTVSMPQHQGQEPFYYNYLNTGRPTAPGTKRYQYFKTNYIDVPNDPLYPFGYGLSYTTFKYGPTTLSRDKMPLDGEVQASVTVQNTGAYEADEVVQLYIRDLVAEISRPVKELRGFQRIRLKPGESRTVSFTIRRGDLSYYNYSCKQVTDPGDFDIMIGPNSRDLTKARLTVTP